ncbi:hypothetical protein NC652_039204 [Populus alba x Populus x berolinensis]|nr:hypothetical protein NC652_039204 [Populus alba x Populus x berolinensis]
MLEEDLENDELSVGDGDGDGDVGDDIEDEDGDEEEEEEERPMTLKYWQLRRLARALKTGHCKNSVKSLAAELFLDRAVVLDLLRDTPLNLVVMSVALPDVPAPTLVMLETIPIEIVPEETGNVDVTGTEVKVPIHVMQGSWFARKRLKKVHVDTPYSVYRRTRRPTINVLKTVFLNIDAHFKVSPSKYCSDSTQIKSCYFHTISSERESSLQSRTKDIATLQRSTAFRRQGSSGVVWEDEYFLKEDKVDYKELKAMSECKSCQHDRSRQIEGRTHCFPSQLSSHGSGILKMEPCLFLSLSRRKGEDQYLLATIAVTLRLI